MAATAIAFAGVTERRNIFAMTKTLSRGENRMRA
jgi:hypothetical protein